MQAEISQQFSPFNSTYSISSAFPQSTLLMVPLPSGQFVYQPQLTDLKNKDLACLSLNQSASVNPQAFACLNTSPRANSFHVYPISQAKS